MSALPVDEFARRAAALGERLNADAPTSWRPDKPELEHPRVLVGVLVGQEPSPSVGYEGRSTTIAVICTPEQGDWSVGQAFCGRSSRG